MSWQNLFYYPDIVWRVWNLQLFNIFSLIEMVYFDLSLVLQFTVYFMIYTQLAIQTPSHNHPHIHPLIQLSIYIYTVPTQFSTISHNSLQTHSRTHTHKLSRSHTPHSSLISTLSQASHACSQLSHGTSRRAIYMYFCQSYCGIWLS